MSTLALLARETIAEENPKLVPTIISQIFIQQCFFFVVATILVYDCAISMDKEIRYFWRLPINSVSLLYFGNRYLGILGVITPIFFDVLNVGSRTCRFALWTSNAASWVTVLIIDYILILRVLALWHNDKILSRILKTLLVLEGAAKLFVFIYGEDRETIGAVSVTEDVSVCRLSTAGVETIGIIDWLLPMVFGLMLMGLAFYKATDYWRLVGFRGSHLLKVVVQDQAIYYILVVACSLLNIIEFKVNVKNFYVANILDSLGRPSILCLLGSRMLFNLKDAGERGVNEGTNYKLSEQERGTVSNIEFANGKLTKSDDDTCV